MTSAERLNGLSGTATGQRVFRSAIERFAKQGFAGTTVREICSDAGLTTAGAYYYFASKEDLLYQLIRQGQTALIDTAQRALAGVDDPIDRLALLIRSLAATHAVFPMLTRVADGELGALASQGPHLAEILALRDAYEGFWEETLAAGVSSGAFAIADQRVTRLSLIAMCTGVSGWFSPAGPLTVEGVCDELAQIAFRVVAARRGGNAVSVDQTPRFELSLLPQFPWDAEGVS